MCGHAADRLRSDEVLLRHPERLQRLHVHRKLGFRTASIFRRSRRRCSRLGLLPNSTTWMRFREMPNDRHRTNSSGEVRSRALVRIFPLEPNFGCFGWLASRRREACVYYRVLTRKILSRRSRAAFRYRLPKSLGAGSLKSKALRDTRWVRAAQPILRRADAYPGAITDLVDRVACV